MMDKAIVLFLLIVLIFYFAYKFYYSTERMTVGGTVTSDICSQQFGTNEDLRVSLANSSLFERWYLTKDNIMNIQQGTVGNNGSTFTVQKMFTKQFTDSDLTAIRTLSTSQSFNNVSSGYYSGNDVTYSGAPPCNPADQGWLWTYMTLDRCITVECQGRVPAADSVQAEIKRLSAMVPGYTSVKPQ
jgi:hypothetical protein